MGAGRSIIEILWEELDTIVDEIRMNGGEPETFEAILPGGMRKEAGNPDEWQEYGEQRGRGQGVAYCIAVLENPYQPNIEDVRARAMQRADERWEEE